jgi:hypothetical protein
MTKYLLIVVTLLVAANASAQHPNFAADFSVGPKIGYTFGEPGSITLGLEVSYFPNDQELSDPYRYGLTFDMTFWEDHFSMHLGAEILALLFVGIDMGPTLISDYKSASIGLGAIAFAGLIVYPYYETVLFANIKHESVGSYIKLPFYSKYGEIRSSFN